MIGVANADGKIAPSEVAFIEKMFRHLELDASDIYSRLNATASSAETGSQQIRAERDSARAGRCAPGGLDLARLAAIRAETAGAASVLSAIFADDKPEVSASSIVANAPPPSETKADTGLDQRHQLFLLTFAEHETFGLAKISSNSLRSIESCRGP